MCVCVCVCICVCVSVSVRVREWRLCCGLKGSTSPKVSCVYLVTHRFVMLLSHVTDGIVQGYTSERLLRTLSIEDRAIIVYIVVVVFPRVTRVLC